MGTEEATAQEKNERQKQNEHEESVLSWQGYDVIAKVLLD
jgi:hypothetical protein